MLKAVVLSVALAGGFWRLQPPTPPLPDIYKSVDAAI
jgi:hypothetical protein